MAYPVKQSSTDTDFGTSVTSMPVNMPATVDSGDLLIALVEVRNAGTWTKPSGWEDIATLSQAGGGSVGKLNGFYKIASGSEDGGTATWTASVGTTAAWQVIRITDWHGTTPPEALTASGDVTAANPPSLTASWGAADNLFIAVAGHTASSTAAWSASPSGYSAITLNGASGGGAAVCVAHGTKDSASATEDPGTFTVSGSNRWWAAATIAVRPAEGGGGGDPVIVTIIGGGFINAPR